MPSKIYLCEYIDRYIDKELEVVLEMTPDGMRSYLTSLNLLLRYATNTLGKPSFQIKATELNFELVYDFMTETSALKNWKPRTWNVRLAGIKAFFKFLAIEDLWFLEEYKRIREIHTKRIVRGDAFYLTEEEIHQALSQIRPNSWMRLRDITLVQFMFATGLRAAEVCNLKTDDILWVNSKTAHVRFIGKGRKDRVLPVVEHSVYNNLKKFISHSDVNSDYVFPSSSGTRMSRSNLRDRIKRIFSTLDLEDRVTPHTMRRSAAMNWLLRGMSIEDIAANLGHEDIITTQRYLGKNLELRKIELKKIALTSKGFEQFKFERNPDEFLDRLAKRTKRRPRIN